MERMALARNYTVILRDEQIVVTADNSDAARDRDYEQFMADVWVGIVLTLMVLSCICCMCSFLLYHKFQQWKMSSLEHAMSLEAGGDASTNDSEALPNYTLVSGLPSYDEALEQLRQIRQLSEASILKMAEAQDSVISNKPAELSVAEFLQIYKNQRMVPHADPS